MRSKFNLLFSFIFVLTIQTSCQNSNRHIIVSNQADITKYSSDNFFKQISSLDEFKQEQKRIDSLNKATGLSITFSIDIIRNSFLKEDSLKNISLSYINEEWPNDDYRTIYVIKYDKTLKKIISIDKYKK
jgi:hypothetical protein